jgi:hypothetical protein
MLEWMESSEFVKAFPNWELTGLALGRIIEALDIALSVLLSFVSDRMRYQGRVVTLLLLKHSSCAQTNSVWLVSC